MKRLIAAVTTLLSLGSSPAWANNPVHDHHQMVMLDAEDLAEAGIKDAYDKLKPILKSYVAEPAEIAERIDNDLPSYSISCSGVAYDIYSPTLPNLQGESWGRATYAFFAIVNNQLKGSTVKFYAINGGNDLGGMFLTKQQVAAAKKSLKKKTDWPYLPTLEPPWYGLHH